MGPSATGSSATGSTGSTGSTGATGGSDATGASTGLTRLALPTPPPPPPDFHVSDAQACRIVLRTYQEEGFAHRSNLRQFNSSLRYCSAVGVCSSADVKRKIERRGEIERQNLALGIAYLTSQHANDKANALDEAEVALADAALEDVASEMQSVPPASVPDYVAACVNTTSTFVQSLPALVARTSGMNKQDTMSGMVHNFCKQVIMCRIPKVTVAHVEHACSKASRVFLMEDLTLTDDNLAKYEEQEAIAGAVVQDTTEMRTAATAAGLGVVNPPRKTSDPVARRKAQVRKFCSIAAGLERGGAEKDMFVCPQQVVETKLQEEIVQGLKLGAVRAAPSDAAQGNDIVRAAERLEQNLVQERHEQGLTREDKDEWAAFVRRTD